MSKETNHLKLFKYDQINDCNSTFNIDKALNGNWDKIDADSKQKETDIKEVKSSLDDIEKQISSIEVTAEKTKLKNSNFKSTDVNGGMNELFQYANDIKSKWNNVLGTNLTSTNSSEEYKNHTQLCKNKLASNLGAKGVGANSNESLSNLVDKISNIFVGKKVVTGVMPVRTELVQGWNTLVSNLGFNPSIVILTNEFNKVNFYRKSILIYAPHYNLRTIDTFFLQLGSSTGIFIADVKVENNSILLQSYNGGFTNAFGTDWIAIE